MAYEFDKLKKLLKPFEEKEEIIYPEDETQMVENIQTNSKPIVVNLENIKVNKSIPQKQLILSNKPNPFEKGTTDTTIEYLRPTMTKNQRALKNLAFRIGKLESSSGANVEHPIITDPKSMHYGSRAIGEHALMPRTIYDVINRISKDTSEYNQLRQLFKPTSDEYEYNFQQDDIEEYINKHPEIYNKIFEDQLAYTKAKVGGDDALTSVAWLVGTESTPEQLNKILQSKSSRGNEARERLHRYQKIAKEMDPLVEREVTPSVVPDSTFNTKQSKIMDILGMGYDPYKKLNPLQKGRFLELMKYLK